jgi:glycerol-3-phosphate O-acyltransferase
VDDQVAWLVGGGLLSKIGKDDDVLRRPQAGSDKEQQLRIMGQTLLQTFERYFITVAILNSNGSGTLTRGELERLCFLTAQRLAQLNEFAAPEFSDRNLFKQFIALLRDEEIISTNEDEKLEFNEKIQQLSNDAKFILSKEIRHGILRAAPQVPGAQSKHQDPE